MTPEHPDATQFDRVGHLQHFGTWTRSWLFVTGLRPG
jgi:hypothetical protein